MADKDHLSDTPSGSPFPISRTPLLPNEFNEEEFARLFRALSTNSFNGSNHQNLGFNSNILDNNNDILELVPGREIDFLESVGGISSVNGEGFDFLGSRSRTSSVHGREIDFLGSKSGTSSVHGAKIDFLGSEIGTSSTRDSFMKMRGFEEQRHGFLGDYSAYQSPISSLQNPNLNLCLGLPGSSSSTSGLYNNTHILNSFASKPLMAETTSSRWENNSSSANINKSGLDGYSYEFFDHLMRFRNWSASKVLKLINEDPTLIDETSSFDIAFMSNFKLGSRLLGKVLHKCNKYHAKKLLTQISDILIPLMINEFGCSIFQKLLLLGEAPVIEEIVIKIISKPHEFKNAANSPYGAYSIRTLFKAAKSTNPSLINSLFSTLYPEILSLMMDKNGSGLIDYFLQNLDGQYIEIINRVAVDYFPILAPNRYGCVIIQMVTASPKNRLRNELLLEISSNALSLAYHPYGNYVIKQALLQSRNSPIGEDICKSFQGNFASLSKSKWGNFAVQNYFQLTKKGANLAILEFLSQGDEFIIELANDEFGNYVVQCALKVIKKTRYNLFQRLLGILLKHSKDIQSHPNGKNVFRLITQRYIFCFKNRVMVDKRGCEDVIV